MNLFGVLAYDSFIRAAEKISMIDEVDEEILNIWESMFSEDILKFTFKYKILDFEIFGMKQERNFNWIMAAYALLIV